MMRAFGGEIACASTPGEFTEFTMRFPAISEEEREAHWRGAVAQARTVLAGKRVLIVEDDAVQRMATRHKLGPLAVTAELDEAADGQVALDMLGKRAYDIVLLDLHMPGLDGYAVAEKIRNEPGINRDVRIVAYTSEPAHWPAPRRSRAAWTASSASRARNCRCWPPCSSRCTCRAVWAAMHRAAAGRRILLADDSSFSRKAVAAYLRNAAATVIEAEHGRAVLDQLNAHEGFDAVILDLHMPGMDGLETARAIRESHEPWAVLPIVALTAHSDEPAVTAARAAGMDGFPGQAGRVGPALRDAGAAGGRQCRAGSRTCRPAGACRRRARVRAAERAAPESYRRLGMVEELLDDYVPEMARLVLALQDAAGRQDRQASWTRCTRCSG
ncbi:response regulator [Ramlibacter terrae]|uniref:Response regulator n=1 Tax=Ramlibacter terrae TaxID=2732511 RepID=A0ABX6P333_9BURK|nr:response regulator [Ramlibacter terrae]